MSKNKAGYNILCKVDNNFLKLTRKDMTYTLDTKKG